jgi:hypothetical protein
LWVRLPGVLGVLGGPLLAGLGLVVVVVGGGVGHCLLPRSSWRQARGRSLRVAAMDRVQVAWWTAVAIAVVTMITWCAPRCQHRDQPAASRRT